MVKVKVDPFNSKEEGDSFGRKLAGYIANMCGTDTKCLNEYKDFDRALQLVGQDKNAILSYESLSEEDRMYAKKYYMKYFRRNLEVIRGVNNLGKLGKILSSLGDVEINTDEASGVAKLRVDFRDGVKFFGTCANDWVLFTENLRIFIRPRDSRYIGGANHLSVAIIGKKKLMHIECAKMRGEFQDDIKDNIRGLKIKRLEIDVNYTDCLNQYD